MLGVEPPSAPQGFLKKKKKILPLNFFIFLVLPLQFFLLIWPPKFQMPAPPQSCDPLF